MATANTSNHLSEVLCTIHLNWTSRWCSPIACNPRINAYISLSRPANNTNLSFFVSIDGVSIFRLVDWISQSTTKSVENRLETYLKFWTVCCIAACLKAVEQIKCFVEYFVQFAIYGRSFFCWFSHCLLRRLAGLTNKIRDCEKKTVREANVSNFQGRLCMRRHSLLSAQNIPQWWYFKRQNDTGSDSNKKKIDFYSYFC